MKKQLFGKEYVLEKITKDEQDWLRWEMPAIDFENYFKDIQKEIEKKTGVKPDIQKEFDKLEEYRKRDEYLSLQIKKFSGDLKVFLDNFSCEELGYLYGNKRIQNNNEWFSKTQSLNIKLAGLINPISEAAIEKNNIYKEKTKLVKSICEKVGVDYSSSIFCQNSLLCNDVIEAKNKEIEKRNFLLYTAGDIFHANDKALKDFHFADTDYNKRITELKDKIVQMTKTVLTEKEAGILGTGSDRELIYQMHITQLDMKLNDLKTAHAKELENVRIAHAKEIKGKEDEYDVKGQVLKTEIEKLNDRLKEQNTEINGLNNDNKILKSENEKQDKKLSSQKTINGILVATMVAVAVVPPLIQNFDYIKDTVAKKLLKRPIIEQKHIPQKLDTLIIHEKKDTVKNFE